ncbi:hypothetical protein Dimus_025436 [Dionaea muscipula]
MAMNNGLRSCASKLLNSPSFIMPNSGESLDLGFPSSTISTSFFLRDFINLYAVDFGSDFWSDFMSMVNRGFHSSGVKMMGGGHGHNEPYYLHAKHMYNLDRVKFQGLKMTVAVCSAVGIGIFVPIYAVIFQQKKTASG